MIINRSPGENLMKFPKGKAKLDLRRIQLINHIEIASASLREKGKEKDAIILLRLRTKIREGLSFEEAKEQFNSYTKILFIGEM